MDPITKRAWIVIEGKSGHTNLFPVPATDENLVPGKNLPASYKAHASGQESARIIARFDPHSFEAEFFEAIEALQILFWPNRQPPLSSNGAAAIIQQVASGIRKNGFSELDKQQ